MRVGASTAVESAAWPVTEESRLEAFWWEGTAIEEALWRQKLGKPLFL